jgi:multicomponent Na+:H+ antiporter subunit F
MTDFLLAAASCVLAIAAAGLWRLLIGPHEADRLMAIQLLGTGSVAVLLLLSAATRNPLMIDVALTLSVLAAFAGVAFVKAADGDQAEDGE